MLFMHKHFHFQTQKMVQKTLQSYADKRVHYMHVTSITIHKQYVAQTHRK